MNTRFLPFLAVVSLIACCIEVDISVPGFPDMAQYFNVSDTWIQLTLAYNFLGFCLAGFLHGPLSESYGRRKVMLIGNAGLVVGAIGCVLSNSITMLLVMRFIQGIGASTSAVVVFAMIADVYPNHKAVKLIGMMNALFSALIAIAPVIGGIINEAVGWRGNYTIVAGITLISWILMLVLLPETKPELTPFNSKKIIKDFVMLISSLTFLSASIVPSVLYAGYLSFVACAPFLYRETYGLTTISYAFHQGFIVACFSLISIFSGPLIQSWGARKMTHRGILLCGFSAVGLILSGLFFSGSPFQTTVLMSLFSIGIALIYPVIFSASLEIFPEIKGTASSLIMAMRAFLCAAFIGMTSYFYNGEALVVGLVIWCIFMCSFVFTLIILQTSRLLH